MSDEPMKPFWKQPSHPSIQEVIFSPNGFTSKSLSKVDLPPFGLFAKFDFPPCTPATKATYATVQCGRNSHLNLNSDLVYINHSCEPSLIFDTTTLTITAGPLGLRASQELTFFYPSTEWSMSQPFQCFCSTPSCKRQIAGASQMSKQQLEGMWLNGYIREMIEERDDAKAGHVGHGENGKYSQTATQQRKLLEIRLEKAKMQVRAAEENLRVWGVKNRDTNGKSKGEEKNGKDADGDDGKLMSGSGALRRGVSSREMSGEMGGDTVVV